DWLPEPQFWVRRDHSPVASREHLLAFKDVTATTNVRTMIAAFIPGPAAGNTLPLFVPGEGLSEAELAFLAANLNAMSYDFISRQKVQGQHLNWYIVEQLPVVSPDTYQTVRF